MPDDCWACALSRGALSQHKTPWFYIGHEGAVVQDLDARSHAMRLLFVPKNHVACGGESEAMRRVAFRLLSAVAAAVCQNEGFVLRGFDMDNHSFRAHWHAQAILERG